MIGYTITPRHFVNTEILGNIEMNTFITNCVKWTATIVMIIAGYLNATGWVYGPTALFGAGLIWLVASIMMKEKSLIVTNLFMAVVTVYGISQNSVILGLILD